MEFAVIFLLSAMPAVYFFGRWQGGLAMIEIVFPGQTEIGWFGFRRRKM